MSLRAFATSFVFPRRSGKMAAKVVVHSIFHLSITGATGIWPAADVDSSDVWIPWAVAIFVCYTNMMLFLRRYRLFGTYISMYTEVIKTVVQVMVVFVFLVLGFALVFYILKYYHSRIRGHYHI